MLRRIENREAQRVDVGMSCVTCGARYRVHARCTPAEPMASCEASGYHVHVFCAQCGAEHLELPDARELRWLASVN